MQTLLLLLSVIPIIGLLLCLIVFKISVAKSGAAALIAALIVALGFFGMPLSGLSVAAGKALSLALFVSLIVWCALFLYHLVDNFKAVEVINKNIILFIGDKFVQFVLLAWLFTGLLQGMAGFGVPSVIVAPILIALGFDKVRSLSATLLGHSWAITFGSMGAAFYIIQMITGIPPEDLGVPMWIFNTCTHFLTGIGVCWMYGGIKGVKQGLAYVLPVSAVMAGTQYFVIISGMYSLAALITALAGLTTMFILYKLRTKTKQEPKIKTKNNFYKDSMNLLQAIMPYAVILILSLGFQFLPQVLKDISISFKFPGFETTLGHIVPAESGYSRIRLFGHPSVILLCASAAAVIIYKRAGVWDKKVFYDACKKTVKKGVPATLALLALGNMSLIMMDSGMTHRLAYNIADFTGAAYPVFAPFFGVLASFLTGNNTNSNVLFGSFQQTIALRLGVSEAVMSAAQSIAGGLGCAIGPTLVLMGAIATDQDGGESLIYKKLILPVLLIAFIMGIINLIILNF